MCKFAAAQWASKLQDPIIIAYFGIYFFYSHFNCLNTGAVLQNCSSCRSQNPHLFPRHSLKNQISSFFSLFSDPFKLTGKKVRRYLQQPLWFKCPISTTSQETDLGPMIGAHLDACHDRLFHF